MLQEAHGDGGVNGVWKNGLRAGFVDFDGRIGDSAVGDGVVDVGDDGAGGRGEYVGVDG